MVKGLTPAQSLKNTRSSRSVSFSDASVGRCVEICVIFIDFQLLCGLRKNIFPLQYKRHNDDRKCSTIFYIESDSFCKAGIFIHIIIVFFLVSCVEMAEKVCRKTKKKFDSI